MKFAKQFEDRILDGTNIFTVRNKRRDEKFTINLIDYHSSFMHSMDADVFLSMTTLGVFNSKSFGFDSNQEMYDYYDEYFWGSDDIAFLHRLSL